MVSYTSTRLSSLDLANDGQVVLISCNIDENCKSVLSLSLIPSKLSIFVIREVKSTILTFLVFFYSMLVDNLTAKKSKIFSCLLEKMPQHKPV